jgi:mono/diheme cytochrome c family protein
MTGRRAGAAFALAIAAASAAVIVGAAVPGPTESAQGDPIRGQALFVSKGCVDCHAVRGTGGRMGPDLGRAAIKGSFPEIAAGLWNHSPVMEAKMRELRVARPRFEKNELADLIAFLYFLNYFDEPGDPRAGKVLFAEKHCIRCHAVGREGGTIGPRLDTIPRGAPPLRIAQALWNHGAAMMDAMQRMGLDPPRFQGSEFLDLVAFLRSQGVRAAPREFRSAGEPEAGRRLFAGKGCARCHAVFGRGGRVGPDLGRAELRGSVTQLAGTMWNHWPAMSSAMEAIGMAPPTFAGDELADVFAYLFLVRYDGPPSDRARGAAVYAGRGCAQCHGAGGEGGIGPRLRGQMAGEAPERVLQRMWNHAPGMLERMSAQGTAWPRFEGGELADLLSFLGAGMEARAVPQARPGRRAP